jgi:hypothetical protein
VIIEGHTIEAGIDMLMFIPPHEEVLVLDIFGPSTQISGDFINEFVNGNIFECRKVVKNV